MKDLIAKLEAASEGSRELNLEIHKACNRCDPTAVVANNEEDVLTWDEPRPWGSTVAYESMADFLPPYTTSLDAALTLVPEGWFGDVRVGGFFTKSDGEAWLRQSNDVPPMKSVVGASPAIALCIAALRARAA